MNEALKGAKATATAGSFAQKPTGLQGAQATFATGFDDGQVARDTAERQRRNIAATSTDTVNGLPPAASTSEPPSPRSNPFEAGIAAGHVFKPTFSFPVQEQPDHPKRFTHAGVQDGGASYTTAASASPSAASTQVIERRLLESPDDIRVAARGFAEAFRNQIDELRGANQRSQQYDDVLAFLEQMAVGLAELADALDRAFETTTPQPIFTNEAAQIARKLHIRVVEWLEWIGTDAIDVPMIRYGVLCGGVAFLHSLGADSAAGIGALYWSIHRRRDGG